MIFLKTALFLASALIIVFILGVWIMMTLGVFLTGMSRHGNIWQILGAFVSFVLIVTTILVGGPAAEQFVQKHKLRPRYENR